MVRTVSVAVWLVLLLAMLIPVGLSLLSPLLEWRDPIYIVAGGAGVISLSLLLVQPLLAAKLLPNMSTRLSRKVHQTLGLVLVLLVIIHVVALWITSPPDVIDALLFVSATSFSKWGVIAMWTLFASALLALLRPKLPLQLNAWRVLHKSLAVIIVITSVIHAIQIDGTMEVISKTVLCAVILFVTAFVLLKLRRVK